MEINLDKALKEIVSRIPNYVHTPPALSNDMASRIDNTSATVLVVRTIEFIRVLKQKGHDMSKVWFTASDERAKKLAITLGVNPKQIDLLDVYMLMKFDYVIMNPPYNPKAIWKNFVEMGMDLIKDDGKMIIIHPATWRESTKYKKLAEKIKTGIVELHIMDYEAFKENKVATKTDWYVWRSGYSGEQDVTYSNGVTRVVDLKNTEWILRIPEDSIPARILKKITSDKHNGIIIEKGYNPLYKQHDPNGKYKQCGLEGNGTGWTIGNFGLTNDPTKHQFKNKVVISYAGKPRAQFFSKDDNIGVVRASYWLTDNKSLPILINSKMFWKIVGIEIAFWHNGDPTQLSPWILESLDFVDLVAETDEELYQHYKLTEEEIQWIHQTN